MGDSCLGTIAATLHRCLRRATAALQEDNEALFDSVSHVEASIFAVKAISEGMTHTDVI